MSTMFQDFGAVGETSFGTQTHHPPSDSETEGRESAEIPRRASEAHDTVKPKGALMSWRNEEFRMKVRLQKVVNDFEFGTDFRPVAYKSDGSRFDIDTTIKLNVNASYQVSFNFRPIVRIERLEIMDDVKTPTETARDIESITYIAYFDTKTRERSKNKERSKIHFTLDLGEHGHLNFDILAKFYPDKSESHVSWGNVLHEIELEALCVDGEVKVSKTKYR
ncbi:uncharacterized protein LOC100904299 [Galendromus occidentalis]|uniref:CB1 cannabinoid receptor-interacting protein 1 n=1 Tax=Galendromus occidentalis TaxID=34638 RepID=A0AAJ6VUF4_9ACAR|nr:uncharacterized protein LOC100904299 [Galendromus occidentalis]